MERVLSGMQPSGNPHLGNYLGAMRQHVAMQNEHECFYFIANYHALTTVHNADQMRKSTIELATDYLALGLDPKKTAFFLQSDIPELTELSWVFSCLIGLGILERAHAWKDALAKKKKDPSVGLFTYPVLMACDILMYHPDLVPVGQDQKQHVEITRDIAGAFNHVFGETFKLPKPVIPENVATVPGTDGEKMSKSYGNTIDIFAPEDQLKKQVMEIVTDSKGVSDRKDTETCNVAKLVKLVASQAEYKDLAHKYSEGGFGYGEAKKLLLEAILKELGQAREKRIDLERKTDYVKEVLQEGAKRARALAKKTMEDVRSKTGLSLNR